MYRILSCLAGTMALLGCATAGNSAQAEQVYATVAVFPRVLPQQPPITPQFFRTVAVPISASRYWQEWERARRDASTTPELKRLIAPAAAMPFSRQVEFVQAAVHRKIKWRSDMTLWGRHDYWASAEETLRRGFGDMEDRAIVKMQALRALGTPSSDLYLTLGRDTVAGPQTVLIVRDGRRYYVLDDAGGPPYMPERRPEFSPVLTFGYGSSWVHMPPGSGQLRASKVTPGRTAFVGTAN